MQLHAARLCSNCEEIHDAQRCPRCGSGTFAYLTRWVPRLEAPAAVPPPILVPTRAQRIIFGGGAIGLVSYVLFRWYQRVQKQVDVHSWRTAGELR